MHKGKKGCDMMPIAGEHSFHKSLTGARVTAQLQLTPDPRQAGMADADMKQSLTPEDVKALTCPTSGASSMSCPSRDGVCLYIF